MHFHYMVLVVLALCSQVFEVDSMVAYCACFEVPIF